MTPKHTKYQNRSSLSKPSLHLSLSHSSPTRRGQRPLIRILIECSSAFTFTRTIPQSRQTVHRQTASSSNAETAIRNNKNCYRDQGYLHACGGRTGLGDVLPPGLFQVEFEWGWPAMGWVTGCGLRHVGSICATFSVALLGLEAARGSDRKCLRVLKAEVIWFLRTIPNTRALLRCAKSRGPPFPFFASHPGRGRSQLSTVRNLLACTCSVSGPSHRLR